MLNVLMAGESWTTHTRHIKGYDSFEASSYHEGGTQLIAALRDEGIAVTYLPNHAALDGFPFTMEELAKFDVVLLSDIGINTLLLPDRTAVLSQRSPNRVELIADFVRAGGGLLMVGGYLSFQGFAAKANYHRSAIEAVLPVVLSAHDDRVELPQGTVPVIVEAAHQTVAGLKDWPHFLGLNRTTLHPEGSLVASLAGDPLIAVRSVERGRSAIFASDCGPHWGPPEFLEWAGYGPLWVQLVSWLGRVRA